MTETDHSATASVPANLNFCGGFFGEKVPLVPASFGKPEDIGLTVRPGTDHFGEFHGKEGLVA